MIPHERPPTSDERRSQPQADREGLGKRSPRSLSRVRLKFAWLQKRLSLRRQPSGQQVPKALVLLVFAEGLPQVPTIVFYLDYRYFSMATPGSLGDFSVRLFEQEREKAAQLWDDTMAEGIGYLRNIFLELVRHAAERLSPDEDGKPKTFQKSTIDKLKEFLETFEIRNIADDRELAPLVARMRNLLQGVDAESLRTSDLLRERMAQQLTKIASQVDQMPAVKRTRLITFED